MLCGVMHWQTRGIAIKIAFCVAALWLCTSWTTPGLLLATVTDSQIAGDVAADTTVAAAFALERPRAREVQAAGAQRGGGAVAGGSSTEAAQPAPPELQDLAACVQQIAPATPVSMNDIIVGKAPQ